MMKGMDRSLTRFMKLTIDGVTHLILREPNGRQLAIAEQRLKTCYPKKTIEIAAASRLEWGLWNGLTVLTSCEADRT